MNGYLPTNPLVAAHLLCLGLNLINRRGSRFQMHIRNCSVHSQFSNIRPNNKGKRKNFIAWLNHRSPCPYFSELTSISFVSFCVVDRYSTARISSNHRHKMSLPALLNPPQTPKFHPSLSPPPHLKFPSLKTLKIPTKLHSFPPSLQSQFPTENDSFDDQDQAIGDCIVFEEGIFEDPYLDTNNWNSIKEARFETLRKKKKRVVAQVEAENLVPENWREVQAEINIGKKERRKIAQEMDFNKKFERKRQGLLPIRSVNLDEYKAFKEAKLAQLKPLVLDSPESFKEKEEEEEEEDVDVEVNESGSERVKGKNPRWAVYGKGLEDVRDFFNSGDYEPGEQKSEGKRKLFTKGEKALLNKRVPDLATASSSKWLPLHTLAASGEFYLMDELLKHNVNINATDANGWTALHRAIVCKKQAITSYLLRESADPSVRDADGASLMHYAVQTASAPAIKLLLLYNVNVDLQDNDGWTPLHLAVQARRTDIVKLLLIKGADRTIKNQDGLTPLDLCLYSGRDTRTYELIKLLKQYATKKATSLAKNLYNVSTSLPAVTNRRYIFSSGHHPDT